MSTDAGGGTRKITSPENPTPETLPPEQRREAQELEEHMPEGRGPRGEEKKSTWKWLIVFSVAILAALIGIFMALGDDPSAMVVIGLITLAYIGGMLPLIHAAVLRERDRKRAARIVRDEAEGFDRRPRA